MRLTLLLLLACGDPADGTSIGNPNKTFMRLADPGTGVSLTMAEVTIASLVANGEQLQLPDGTDVLEGIPLDLPRDLESLTVVLDDTLDILGTEAEGQLDLQLRVPEIGVMAMRNPLEIDEPHVFELATTGWLEAERVGWTRGEDHVVRPGDIQHDPLVEAVQDSRIRLQSSRD